MQEYDITIKVSTAEGVKSHKRKSTRTFKEVVESDRVEECMDNMGSMIRKFVDETKGDTQSLPELPFDQDKSEEETPTGT